MSLQSFNEAWFDHLYDLLRQLKETTMTAAPDRDRVLLKLVHEVRTHYSQYYRVMCYTARHDVVSLFAAPWSSSLERSLHWIAGWRPTIAFHLVYTHSSILFEARITDILRGAHTGDLGDLSPPQLQRVSELQCQTVREENEIMAELSEYFNSASALVGTVFDPEDEVERLTSVVEKAESLRFRTICSVVEMLSPQQAVEFLAAIMELQFWVHGVGLSHDRER